MAERKGSRSEIAEQVGGSFIKNGGRRMTDDGMAGPMSEASSASVGNRNRHDAGQ